MFLNFSHPLISRVMMEMMEKMVFQVRLVSRDLQEHLDQLDHLVTLGLL